MGMQRSRVRFVPTLMRVGVAPMRSMIRISRPNWRKWRSNVKAIGDDGERCEQIGKAELCERLRSIHSVSGLKRQSRQSALRRPNSARREPSTRGSGTPRRCPHTGR